MKQKQINQEWKEVELKDLVECLDNKRVPLNEEERSLKKGNVPYYGTNNIVGFVNDFIFNEELLLIAEDGGSWGFKEKCAYVINGKSWVNNHAHVLRVDKTKTDMNFLRHFFNLTNLNKYISGTTRGKLNQKAMNSIKIPLPFKNGKPDLKKQKQIISILKKVEKLKEKRKRANELLDEYLKSVFNEMFVGKGFEEVKLGKVFDIARGGSPRPIQDYLTKDDEGLNWIKIGDTKKDPKYIIKTEEKIKKEGLNKTRFVKEGDFILSNSMSFGRPYILKISGCIHDGWLVIKDTNKITVNDYLYMILSSNFVYNQFLKSVSGSTVKNLKIDVVKKVEIPLPPISLQKKFASIVKEVEKLKEKQNKSKEDINELFNSLMQKAFTGELI